jgi:Sec-independent protein translocase protein TatA
MTLLSPTKLLVVLLVALVVLGPEKLPRAARRIGSIWADLQRLKTGLEAEARQSLPDLPSSETVARAVRAPWEFLGDLSHPNLQEDGATAIDLERVPSGADHPWVSAPADPAAN